MTIIQRPSPNHQGRGGYKPDMIVDHITAGDSVQSALNWFANPKAEASAHYVVDKDGTVFQCVDLREAAWGNGTRTTSGDPRYSGYSTLPAVRDRKVNANLYTISIEHVNKWGGALTPAQLAATIDLHRYIIARVKAIYGVDIPADRQHIIGHCEIAPRWKPSCPGAQFPYDKIIAGIHGPAGVVSDTTMDMTLGQGKSYIVKLTASAPPTVTIGTGGILTHSLYKRVGSDYLYRLTAIGRPGQAAGIYANGHKIFTVTIK